MICLMSELCFHWIATLLWNKMNMYTSIKLHLCISYRLNYSRWRRLRTDPGTRSENFWRPWEHRRKFNSSSEPKFGKLWHSCPQPHSRRQAPDINRYFITTLQLHLFIYVYLCITFPGITWNLSCIFLGTYILNTRTWVRLVAKLIGPVEVEWLPVTRKLYTSCNVYISATTIRMTDGVVIMIHDLGKKPHLCWWKLDKVAVCGSGG
jgi:hypothetical protein